MKNKGPGRVMNATVYISWPYEVESGYSKGKHLLYLMEAPQINGNRVSEQSHISCLCRDPSTHNLKGVKPSVAVVKMSVDG